ncbi:MAG: hypothetical protein HOV80_18410 [Polyangiaceae bacterium]|nr:hypothetical protein [Polyangiaceae bacterium]
MRDRACLVVFLVVLGTACGDDDPTGTGGSGTSSTTTGGTTNSSSTGGTPGATPESYCAEVAAHDEECLAFGGITQSQCVGNKITKCLFGGNMRAGVDDQIIQCVLDRPCVDDPFLYSECVDQPGAMSAPPGQSTYKQACINKLFECGTFDDYLCDLNFFEAAAYEDLSACVAMDDCFALADCVNGVVTELCP